MIYTCTCTCITLYYMYIYIIHQYILLHIQLHVHTHHYIFMNKPSSQIEWFEMRIFFSGCHGYIPYLFPSSIQWFINRIYPRMMRGYTVMVITKRYPLILYRGIVYYYNICSFSETVQYMHGSRYCIFKATPTTIM